MSAHPKESTYPYYDSVAYWDNYCKFLLFGSNKKSPPPNIRVFNKVGDAYGFMLDVAYIIDTENKVEFMLVQPLVVIQMVFITMINMNTIPLVFPL
jgi:hypothetical protein